MTTLLEQIDNIFLYFIAIPLIPPTCVVMAIAPMVLNRKFNRQWEPHITKKSSYLISDATPYGIFGRTLWYAQAITSERKAQKRFQVSSSVFRSQVGRFAIGLSYAVVWCSWAMGGIAVFAILRQLVGLFAK